MPRFSRIVTIYNQWHFLEWLADDSLFDSETEFIIVDDCSATPPPAEILAKLNTRGIKLHRMPKNSGRCVARNTGAALARGEWLDFIDGDDRPLPLPEDPAWGSAGVVYFKIVSHGHTTGPHPWLLMHPLLEDPASPDGYLDPRPVSVLWRRALFERTGGFDPRFETNEDFDLVLRTLDQPRAYSLAAKQSYYEHPLQRQVELTAGGIRLAMFRRLPESHPLRQQLIDGETRMLHYHATWQLLYGGHRRYLLRASCSLLVNLVKSCLGLLSRK